MTRRSTSPDQALIVSPVNAQVAKFAAQNRFTDDNAIMEKYKLAGKVVDTVLAQVIQSIQVGSSVASLCRQSDQWLLEQLGSLALPFESGIAFPTAMSRNGIVRYHSPIQQEDASCFEHGDFVKIEMAVHVDGYIASTGHTVVVTDSPQVPLMGAGADAICAAYYAMQVMINAMGTPGIRARQMAEMVQQVAACFRCVPLELGVTSEMRRFVMHGQKVIPHSLAVDTQGLEFEPEVNDVFCISMLMMSGDVSIGMPRVNVDLKPTLFERNMQREYQLKGKSSRALFRLMDEHCHVLPFHLTRLQQLFNEQDMSMNDQQDKSLAKTRLALSECLSHELVYPFTCQTVRQPTKQFVAHLQCTVLVTPDGSLRVTSTPSMPYVHSAYDLSALSLVSHVKHFIIKV